MSTSELSALVSRLEAVTSRLEHVAVGGGQLEGNNHVCVCVCVCASCICVCVCIMYMCVCVPVSVCVQHLVGSVLVAMFDYTMSSPVYSFTFCSKFREY